jgi:glycosyltransferase involved in cell wall biosynthesis
MLSYIKRCAASVADQEGVEYEHIVVDGASTDGTAEWLAGQSRIQGISEADDGMYDAVNKGFRMARGEILAYLNCDEQYLPGTLERVKRYFEEHPGVDIVFGDLLVTRPDGTLIAYRKGYRPRWAYIVTSHLYVLSCTMFLRRRVVEEGKLFNTEYRQAGDMEYVLRLLRGGYRARHIKRYMSAFTMTGQNMSAGEKAENERLRLLAGAPLHIRLMKVPLNVFRFTEKLLSGAYFQRGPLEYAVYVESEQEPAGIEMTRKAFRVEDASFRWRFE